MSVIRFESTTGPFYWYKQAQLVMYDNQLYDMRRNRNSNCQALQEVLEATTTNTKPIVAHVSCGPTIHDSLRLKQRFVIAFDGLRLDAGHQLVSFVTQQRIAILNSGFELGGLYDCLTTPITRMQGMFRRHARARLQAKYLAFAMGTHDRLGVGLHKTCQVQLLPSELLRVLVRCA